MRAFFKNLFFSLILFVLFLIVLELAFRLVRREDALKLSMGHPDPKYHHSLKPNSELHLVSSVAGEYDVKARINNFGFRGADIEIAKKTGQKRIFVAGDSFTFGVGCNDDQTVPYSVQKIVDPTTQSVQVVNAGRGSYSPVTYYLRLRDEIPKFKPDVVVMMLDFSDLRDDWDREKNLIYDKQGNILSSNPYYEYGKFKLWNFLRSKSVLCTYLHNKVVRTFGKLCKLGLREYIRTVIRREKAKAVIARTKTDTINFDGRLFMRGEAMGDEIKKHFKRTGKYILMSRDLTRAANAKFILVMYPYGIYVGPEQWGEGRVFWGFEQHKVDTDLFAFSLVQKFAEENGILFINLLDDFIRHKDQELFFPYDGHFTPVGNQVAAEALVNHPIFQEVLRQLKSSVD